MEGRALIGVLIFVIIVVVLVWAAFYIIERAFPADVQMPAKIVVGLIGLVAILYKLLPMAGI
jgi:hypothetical protein